MLEKIPNGYSEVVSIFGNPREKDYEKNNIISIELPYTLYYEHNPVKKIRCHRLAADNFLAAFNNIREAELENEIQEYNGVYNFRPIRGRTQLSLHSFGIAIDLEASKYPLSSTKRMPDNVVECFKKAGFFYGGDFLNRKDPMHFQLASGY